MTSLMKAVWFSTLLSFASAAEAYYTEPAPAEPFSQAELDQILAPIALYPDSLLSQILMAATYPQDVEEAASWSRAHPELNGDEAVRAVENEPWDPSVVSLVAFPQVLAMMDERRDWAERLGEAFIQQPDAVMDTVQQLRARADAAGNLRSSDEIVVQQQGEYYVIEPPTPEVVYVPYYDPRYVYGNWWWPNYQPVYWDPWYGYSYQPGYGAFGWGYGVGISSGFFFGALDWRHRALRYSSHRPWYYHGRDYRRGHRWTHDRDHRDRRWREGAAPRWRDSDRRWGDRDRRGDRDPRWRDGDRRRRDRDGGRPASNDAPRGTRPTYDRRDAASQNTTIAPPAARTSPGVFGPPRTQAPPPAATRPLTRQASPRYSTNGVPASRPQHRGDPARQYPRAPQVQGAPAARQRAAPQAQPSAPAVQRYAPPAQPPTPQAAPQTRSTAPQPAPADRVKEPAAAEASPAPAPARGGARHR